jgi:NAD(P)-dependent dehydrogenase (short-subunit alcohol dehydrogenase family)
VYLIHDDPATGFWAPMIFFSGDLDGGRVLLTRKVAIVTGAGRGIGRAIAQRLAAEGAAVALTARTEAELGLTAKGIESAGGRAAFVAADASRDEDCRRIVDFARKTFGAVHILVNNAGIYGPVKAVEEITPEEWDEVMAVNLRGPFQLARAVLPAMYAQRSGVIVNIASVAAKAAFGWNGPYAASKAGVVALTRTLAAEAASKGVRVNAVSPGPVPETIMSQELGRRLAEYFRGDAKEMFAQMLKGILQGRPQTAGEIAAAVAFLASDESSAITGQTLNVDGGMAFY